MTNGLTRDIKIYDVAIVGSGPAGLFAAMELASKTNLSVLLLEQVKRLHDTRNVSNGWMGGSAKSDLRLFIEPGFGGIISDESATSAVLSYMQNNCKSTLKAAKDKLSKKFIKRMESSGVNVVEPAAYIIGSEKLTQIENSFQQFLSNRVMIKSNIRIDNIIKELKLFKLVSGDRAFFAKKVILAMGRGGSNWLLNIAKDINLEYTDDSFDLGIRLEFPHNLVREIADKSSIFRLNFDEYRTTAISSFGTVEMENVDEFKTSNARSITGKHTLYSSFGLLKTFAQPDALNKVLRLVQMANVLADGQLLKEPVSRLLNDTSILSPIEEYASLKPGIKKILEILPEIASRCSFYAPEARLNSVKFKLSNDMETNISGMYIAGDMSGHTKSFGQSACSGLLAARHIITTIKK